MARERAACLPNGLELLVDAVPPVAPCAGFASPVTQMHPLGAAGQSGVLGY